MIEQPQSKSNLRRSRSPSSHRKHSDQNGMGMLAGNGVDNKGGIEFKAPLMIEQAEELMLMARLGKSLLILANFNHI